MFPDRMNEMIGMYSRPSSTESTVMDDIVYTNDFREACSFIIDLIAELYTKMRPILPLYQNKFGAKPDIFISELINPHRNHEKIERNGCARLRYHAQITARYVDGHVPTEDGGKLIRAFNAFFNTIKPIHDSIPLRHVEDTFGAYVQIWNRMGRPKLNPHDFSVALHDSVEKIIEALEQLSDDLHVYETNRWQNELNLDFQSADSQVLNQRLTDFANRIIKEEKTTRSAIAEQGVDALVITGPRDEDKKNQILEVVKYLANPKASRSIHDACVKTFKPLPNGYKNCEKLYQWCERNKHKIRKWIQDYRLKYPMT